MKFTTLIVLLAINANCLAQTIITNESEVNGRFTIEQSPYIIEGKAFISTNDTLIIDAGVEIKFTASTASTDSEFTYATLAVGMMRVHGTLIANGTPGQPVMFTRNGTVGKWGIILFDETATDACTIEHAIIEHAGIVRTVVGNNDMSGAISFYRNNATLKNSTLVNNGKDFGSYTLGCGVVSYNATPIITNNTIDQSIEYGIWCLSDYGQETNPIITNNLIINNKEGINLIMTNGLIVNNTIVGNINYGINMMLAAPVIVNTIFYNNGSTTNNDATGTISYCSIDEQSLPETMTDNGGNILNNNPAFSDMQSYRLSETSLCIDAGTIDTLNLYLPHTDLDGNLRIINDTIDMGALEFFTDENSTVQPEINCQIMVYPNPAQNYINIKNANIIKQIKIFSVDGKSILILKENIQQNINISSLPKGVYMIQIDNYRPVKFIK